MRIKKDIQKLATPEKAEQLSRYFKTGKGEYGEGDVFLGLTVPQMRKISKKYRTLDLAAIKELLKSRIHEHRLVALLILVEQFGKADEKERKKIYGFYLANTKSINNWDLVDLTAPRIVGPYLADKDRKVLYRLARSKNLWERRIAVLSTYEFIRNGEFTDSLKIAEILLDDRHDLIHKAVGWMLREVGNRDQKAEEKFLKKHYRKMPRTMLRYAIEKFDGKKKKSYMKK
jgi:3-methyladenine DNA glycosylase AlkD